MQLSVLESRLLRKLPSEYHELIQKEFERFEMETSRLSEEPDKIGQSTLTNYEIDCATTTNQNGDYGHTVVELQCIKAAAIKYGVEDWLQYVDPKLSYEENISIMQEQGNPTSKEINVKRKAREL